MALRAGGALHLRTITRDYSPSLLSRLLKPQRRSLYVTRNSPPIPRKSCRSQGPGVLERFSLASAASQRQLSASNHRRGSSRPDYQGSAEGQQQLISLVRDRMRLVPHPVAIITSTDPSSHGPVSERWRGATVSSFNTVTFTPEPIISFNIKRQSATFTAISLSGQFNIHLLDEGSESESIATKFAGGNEGRPFHDEKMTIESFVRQREGEGSDNEGKPPVIHGSGRDWTHFRGTAFRFLCEHLHDKTVDIGDHVVVFGRVMKVEDFGSSDGSPCLVYADRRYGRVT